MVSQCCHWTHICLSVFLKCISQHYFKIQYISIVSLYFYGCRCYSIFSEVIVLLTPILYFLGFQRKVMVPTCCLCIFQLYFSISQLYFSISKLYFLGFQRKVMVPPCCLWPPLPHSPAVPPLLDWIAKEQWILLTKSGNGETVSLYTSKHILIQKSWFFCLHGKKHTLSERGGINRIKLHICNYLGSPTSQHTQWTSKFLVGNSNIPNMMFHSVILVLRWPSNRPIYSV